MRLTKIDDPRDNLQRADRDQLFRFAKAKGVTEINDRIYNGGNAAELMRMILRQKGFTDINIPYHQLGMPPKVAMAEQPSGQPATTLDDILRQQLKEVTSPEPPKSAVTDKPVAEMSIGELRKACKSRGIHMDRTDNMIKLREKLSGQTAA